MMRPRPAMNKNQVKLLAWIVLLLAMILLAGLALLVGRLLQPSGRVEQGHPQGYAHLLLGNPSQATAETRNRNNFLMEKKYFALSYNNAKGTANWVSWRLSREDLGAAERVQFYPDQELPRGFLRITPRDYTGGGFDRGHLCPHSDRSADGEMSAATFVMTNIIPQSPNLNQKAWAQLEMYCRDLVTQRTQTLYILAGPWGQGGEGKEGRRETIGAQHPVTVPASCWKVIMALDAGPGDDLAKVNGSTRMIAVIMPNNMRVGNRWAGFRVPVKAVEQLTGYKFFDKVPAAIIEPLKEKVDSERIAAPRPPRRAGRSAPDVD